MFEVSRTAVIWEDRCITGCEVESTRFRVTSEDSGTGSTLVEVEPFLSLVKVSIVPVIE